VARGDLWMDTSVNPPALYRATTTVPDWEAVGSDTGGGGEIDASQLTGTLPAEVFPPELNPVTFVGAPMVGAGEYLRMGIIPCSIISTTGTGRLCLDSTGVLKLSVNGAPYTDVGGSSGGGSGGGFTDVSMYNPFGTAGQAGLLLWTNLTNGHEFQDNNSRFRKQATLDVFTQARVSFRASVAGNAGSVLCVEYTTDVTGNTGWTSLNGVAGSGGVCASMAYTSRMVSQGIAGTDASWGTIATAAKGDVSLRLVSYGGDGAADPTFGNVSIQFR